MMNQNKPRYKDEVNNPRPRGRLLIEGSNEDDKFDKADGRDGCIKLSKGFLSA